MKSFRLTHLSDAALDRALEAAARETAAATAWLLAHIAESDARRRYLPLGFPSMFEYCVRHLRFSEDAAYKRIRVARAARMFPAIYRMIADGRLHLAGVLVLAPHLTTANAAELLKAGVHRTRAEIEETIAARFPRPDLPERIVALAVNPSVVRAQVASAQLAPGRVGMTSPEHAPDASPTSVVFPTTADALELAPGRVGSEPGHYATIVPTDAAPRLSAPRDAAMEPHPRVTPLAPERYAIQVTVSRTTHEHLRRAQELLRHQVPDGSVAEVLDRALALLVRTLEQRKCAATDRPRAQKPRRSKAGAIPNARSIPASIRRAVWKRDGGRCTFMGENGRRCDTRGHLEFDHVIPVARGGEATLANLRLRCRAHNQFEADRAYGTAFMSGRRERSRGESLQAPFVPGSS